jgi:uncharacterized protein (DUF1810 family)
MNDPFDLSRFLVAQDETYREVIDELKRGKKTGHWIWFIFPQVAGLGESETSDYYSIASVDEADAYLAHPVLGRRLIECANLVINIDGKTAEQIFGAVDAMKFCSSMTLFGQMDGGDTVFQSALDRYFGGVPDSNTLGILDGA